MLDYRKMCTRGKQQLQEKNIEYKDAQGSKIKEKNMFFIERS